MAEIGKKHILDSGWIAARSTELKLTGIQLTTTHPPILPLIRPWMEAVVPGTVLATLLINNHVPDPFYGLENESIIDIADSGREYYTFWFFTTFHIKLIGGQHLDLNFRAVNYSADVFLNGHKMVLAKGMFRRHSLSVTDIINTEGPNFLAVLVHPPDHPGSVINKGQGGDHEIGKDVAAQYVEGWDWIAPIRDRNTGMWDEVSISVTGPLKITDPHVVATFFDNYKRAYLHATLCLENRSSWFAKCSLNIQVTTDLDDICLVEHLQTQRVSIPPNTNVQYTFPAIFFYKPNLWWPNGTGRQCLYNIIITVDVDGYGESDSWESLFGFRKIESYIDGKTGGRLFKVNGQPVFIRGGNWILSDGLLRLSKERYQTDIKFHADMNFNMMRCWGGGLAERPEFYHYCDIYGIMVWQEFWITGDVDGRGKPVSNPNGPLDHELFMLCARDTVKLLRNHPSLAIWVGGNEQVPPDGLNEALKTDLILHPYFKKNGEPTEESSLNEKDPSSYLDGTRDYIQGSMWDGFADGKGNFTDGPYDIQNPVDFFKDGFYKYGFNPEVGSVGMPVAETIRAIFPPEAWQIPFFKKLPNGYIQEVTNPQWIYHKYIPYSKPGLLHDQICLYGEPEDLDDFCLKAQLVNYTQYKALLEGWSSHMWTKFTGVLIWKTQNPWSALRGQFYDHLLDQTAGFYGCRSAAEPIHVQLNLATYFIEVVNTRAEMLTDVGIEVSVWDLEGECPFFKTYEDNLVLPPKKTTRIVEMKYPDSSHPKPVYFLLLKLYKKSDYGILSRNMYWLHSPGGDYTLLEAYRKKKIPLKIRSEVSIKGPAYEIRMHVHNTSIKGEKKQRQFDPFRKNGDAGVAFFLRLSVHRVLKNGEGAAGEDLRILPVNYSDNYFSVVPGETMSVNISFEAPAGVTPRITLRGWNYEEVVSVL